MGFYLNKSPVTFFQIEVLLLTIQKFYLLNHERQ